MEHPEGRGPPPAGPAACADRRRAHRSKGRRAGARLRLRGPRLRPLRRGSRPAGVATSGDARGGRGGGGCGLAPCAHDVGEPAPDRGRGDRAHAAPAAGDQYLTRRPPRLRRRGARARRRPHRRTGRRRDRAGAAPPGPSGAQPSAGAHHAPHVVLLGRGRGRAPAPRGRRSRPRAHRHTPALSRQSRGAPGGQQPVTTETQAVPLPRYPDLEGKVALVTGGSKGIGAATARALAANHVRVAVNGRDQDALGGIADARGEAIAAPADVCSFDAVERMRERIEVELGAVDILVVFAGGFGAYTPVQDITEEEWHAVIDSNLTSTFLTVKSFLPGMIERRRGSIITMASNAARFLDSTLTSS